MLSRVADSIYWMSRYVERAENVARFVDVNLNMALDLGPDMARQWAPVVYTTGDHQPFEERYGVATQASVVEFLTFDEKNPNSILSCLKGARENARAVREILSSQMWEELNKFYLYVRQASRASQTILDSPFEFFDQIKQFGFVLEGATEATMSHNEAWHFRRLARMIERADKTSRILDVKYYLLLPDPHDVGTPLDHNQWAALLKSVSALEMYRQAYGRITPKKMIEYLVLDREFPRSIRFCLIRAEQSLLAITGGTPGTFRNRAEQRLGRMRSELDYTNVDEIIEQGLHEFIDELQKGLNRAGQAINDTFFAAEPTADTLSPNERAAGERPAVSHHATA